MVWSEASSVASRGSAPITPTTALRAPSSCEDESSIACSDDAPKAADASSESRRPLSSSTATLSCRWHGSIAPYSQASVALQVTRREQKLREGLLEHLYELRRGSFGNSHEHMMRSLESFMQFSPSKEDISREMPHKSPSSVAMVELQPAGWRPMPASSRQPRNWS